MDKLVSYCKQYGFIFQGSEIYGGLANTWDYGPLGARLKNNIKDAWRKKFIQERKNAFELDADILMHPRVWEASGHVGSFSDPLIDCKECKTRHRADNLIGDFDPEAHPDSMTDDDMLLDAVQNFKKIKEEYKGKVIVLHAQSFGPLLQEDLTNFYASEGFKFTSEEEKNKPEGSKQKMFIEL